MKRSVVELLQILIHLVNLPEFYEAFDVKEGDKLYKKPEDRIIIW